MYNRYDEGLYDGKRQGLYEGQRQGFEAGYEAAKDEWYRKGQDSGYEHAWGEANETIYEKNVQLHELSAYAQQLADQISHQNQQLSELYALNNLLEEQAKRLTATQERQADSSRLQTEENRRLQVNAQQMSKVNESVLQELRSVKAVVAEVTAQKNAAEELCNVLVRQFNHGMLVASAACAALQDHREAAALGRHIEIRSWFSRRYYERIDYAMANKVIHIMPQNDPELWKWAPNLSSALLGELDRHSMIYVSGRLDGPLPDLIVPRVRDGEASAPKLV